MASPDAAILAEIARISGAINRAKAASNNTNPPGDSSAPSSASSHSSRGRNPYQQPPPYGSHRGTAYPYRGGRGYPVVPYASSGGHHYRGSSTASHSSYRGSGRGQHHHHQPAVTRTNNTWKAPSSAAASTSSAASTSKDGHASGGSKHKTLILNNNSSTKDKSESISPAASSSTPLPVVEHARTKTASTSSLPDDKAKIATAMSTHSKTEGEMSSTFEAFDSPAHDAKIATTEEEGRPQDSEKAQEEQEDIDMEEGEIDESKLAPPEPKKPPISLVKQANGEIIINGVTFISDASGRKLIRKDSNTTNADSGKVDAKGKGKMNENGSIESSTPSKTSVDGQSYVRTKSGNLISTAVLRKRQEMAEKKRKINEMLAVAKSVQKARQANARAQKKKTLCRYFQKTGVCARANTCPYIHDSEKVSICPRFLRNACPLTPSSCPLSHSPNAHRMPHCQHFPRCKRGDECPYTHVQVSEDAKICKDFVGLGWCEKGAECTERHVWECPDFEEKGKCTKRGCKLGHVIRRKNAKGVGEASSKSEMPSFMFLDTNPDPAYVADASISLPAGARKRSASVSVASAEDYSSGEEEAANLVKKKVKVVEVKPKDAMEANDDYVALVFSDVDDETADENGDRDHDEEEDDGSEAESGLEEGHLTSISRKIEPIVYDDDEQEQEEEDTEASDDDTDESEDEDDAEEADTTIKLEPSIRGAVLASASANTNVAAQDSSSEDSDESDEDL